MGERKWLYIFLGVFLLAGFQNVSAQTDPFREVIDYLNNKPYTADKADLTKADLKVGDEVDQALTDVGLSVYTLLRNEPFARHGYLFKDMILQDIFSQTNWYKGNPDFQFGQLSPQESKNVEFIKSIESNYDYDNIANSLKTLNSSLLDDDLYSAMSLPFPHYVLMSLHHVRLNPSRLLRNLIFAKRGYIFNEPLLKNIFSRTDWYSPKSGNIADILPQMSKTEVRDIELLRKKEWVDILDSVNFTLPKGMFSIPTIGFNALFIRELTFQGEPYYYSSSLFDFAEAADAGILDGHKTNVEELVPPDVIARIEAEPDPAKKLVLFFNNKKYKGYADTIVFNHSDMQVPTYLQEAVKDYGVDYLVLLRKEIHARVGVKFADQRSFNIFSKCGWYKARYDLTPFTESRFPPEAKINKTEIRNFSLLEGEELAPKALLYRDKNMVADLKNDSFVFVKVGRVKIPSSESDEESDEEMEIGSEYPTLEAYEKGYLQSVIDDIFKRIRIDGNEYKEQEVGYTARGM